MSAFAIFLGSSIGLGILIAAHLSQPPRRTQPFPYALAALFVGIALVAGVWA